MLQASGGADNVIGSLCHQVWRRTLCRDAADWWRHRQRRWWPLPPSLATGFLLGCGGPAVAQTAPVVALVTKFGGELPAGMLLDASAQTTPLAASVTMFASGLPAGMLLAANSADNVFGGPCHQVLRRAPGRDAAGQWRHRHLHCQPLSPSLATGSLLGCCLLAEAHTASSAALDIKFGSRILVGVLLAGGGADNSLGGPCHQV